MAPSDAEGAHARALALSRHAPVRATLEAAALGLIHGPTELLPVSSSGHAAALPWLLRWDVDAWPPDARKELEVALHAGTGAGLLVALREHLPGLLPPGAGRRAALLTPALVPPAVAGLALEGWIETRVRGPVALAAGLLAGAAALAAADARPASRPLSCANWRDGAWLGAAQACALVPGVSRNGMTLAAARARGFDARDASRLSWAVALPVLFGAGGLKGWRLWRAPRDAARTRALGAAAGAGLASTLLTARGIGLERSSPLWPWAAWRGALAASILAVRHHRRS